MSRFLQDKDGKLICIPGDTGTERVLPESMTSSIDKEQLDIIDKIEKGKQDISDLDKVPNGYYIHIPVDNKALLFLLERIFSLGKIHGVTCSYRVEEGKQFVNDIRKDKVIRVYEVDADEYVETHRVNSELYMTSTEFKKEDK